MEELIFKRGARLPIRYRFKHGAKHCDHLLIVMSGFNLPDPTIYDFENVLTHCHSHILWIKDDFNHLPAYYLCQGMSFDIEEGISMLINGVIGWLNKPRVSIIGGSKGGSMALYYGLKHGVNNIISTVPQFFIGRYVSKGTPWEHVGRQMMGEINDAHIKQLDEKLPGMVKNSPHTRTPIYLFTSPIDPQYESEILPNLGLFSRYPRFNFIESRSVLITRHQEVTAFNLPLILALIYQFEHGISPVWGRIKNGEGWPCSN